MFDQKIVEELRPAFRMDEAVDKNVTGFEGFGVKLKGSMEGPGDDVDGRVDYEAGA